MTSFRTASAMGLIIAMFVCVTANAQAPAKPKSTDFSAITRIKADVPIKGQTILAKGTKVGTKVLSLKGAQAIVDSVMIPVTDKDVPVGTVLANTLILKEGSIPADTELAPGSCVTTDDTVVFPAPVVPLGTELLDPGTAADAKVLTDEAVLRRTKDTKALDELKDIKARLLKLESAQEDIRAEVAAIRKLAEAKTAAPTKP